MTEIRGLTDSEINDAARMADTVFRKEGQPSMKKAFPFIFSDAAAHLSLGAFTDGGALVSFVGLVPWDIRIGEAIVHAFSLGSVFTLPEARGQGFASSLLQQIYQHMRQADAPLLFISGIKSLYARTGCVPFGRTFRFTMDAAASETVKRSGRSHNRIREMRTADLNRMHQLAASRPVRYEISVRELGTLIKAEGFASIKRQTHRVLLAEHNDNAVAFLVVGVPNIAGQPGLVIEQAGEPEAVAQLAADAVHRYQLSSLEFPVPWHERELIDCLSQAGLPMTEGNHSGAIRITDGEALIRQLQPWLASRAVQGGMTDLRLTETESGQWVFARGDAQPQVLSPQEVVWHLFDCAAIREYRPANGQDPLPVPLPHTVGLCYI